MLAWVPMLPTALIVLTVVIRPLAKIFAAPLPTVRLLMLARPVTVRLPKLSKLPVYVGK